MKGVVIALALLGSLACAATPPKPLWPQQFSSTLLVKRSGDVYPSITRWFYDATQNAERFDTMMPWEGEYWWANIIVNHATEVDTVLLYQDASAMCYQGPTNGTLPSPNWNNARYVGLAIVDFEEVNHWIEEDHLNDRVFNVYESATKNRIVRMDIDDRRRGEAVEILFAELDQRPQDPSLFVIPPILKADCNAQHLSKVVAPQLPKKVPGEMTHF